MYDVIIIGAGPAGASSAYYLAQAGLKVLVLEKKKFPRFKPCGGGISLKFLSGLPFDVSSAISGKVSRVRYLYQMQDACEVDLNLEMALLNRQKFDGLLASAAVKAGAELKEGAQIKNLEISEEKISVVTGMGEFESKYLIGADGVHSLVAKTSGLVKNRKIWSAVEVEVPALKQAMDTALISFGHFREGYAWSFPKKDYFSVGIGGRGDGWLKEALFKWMKFLGCEAKDSLSRVYAHPLPAAVPGEKLQKGNVLLAGDAAGLVDPLTGEGIRYAIRSGQIASSAILQGKVEEYSRMIYQEISSDFRFAYWARRIFYRFPKLSYRISIKDPSFSKALSHIISGEWGYRQAFFRLLNRILNPVRLLRRISA